MVQLIPKNAPVTRKPINELIDIANNQTKYDGLQTLGYNVYTSERYSPKKERIEEFLKLQPYQNVLSSGVSDGIFRAEVKLGSIDMCQHNIYPQVEKIYEATSSGGAVQLNTLIDLNSSTNPKLDKYGWVKTNIEWPTYDANNDINLMYGIENDDNVLIITSLDKNDILDNTTIDEILREYKLLVAQVDDEHFKQMYTPTQGHTGVIDIGGEGGDYEEPVVALKPWFETVYLNPDTGYNWHMWLGADSFIDTYGDTDYVICPALTFGGNPARFKARECSSSQYGGYDWNMHAIMEDYLVGKVTLTEDGVPVIEQNAGSELYPEDYPYHTILFGSVLNEDDRTVKYGTYGKASLDAPIVDSMLSVDNGVDGTLTKNSLEYKPAHPTGEREALVPKYLQIHDFDGSRTDTSCVNTFTPELSVEKWLITNDEYSEETEPQDFFMIQHLDQDGNREVQYKAIKFNMDEVEASLIDEAKKAGAGAAEQVIISSDLSGSFWVKGEDIGEPLSGEVFDNLSATCFSHYICDFTKDEQSDEPKATKRIIDLSTSTLLDDWNVSGDLNISGDTNISSSLNVNKKFTCCNNQFTLSNYYDECRMNWTLRPPNQYTNKSREVLATPDEIQIRGVGIDMRSNDDTYSDVYINVERRDANNQPYYIMIYPESIWFTVPGQRPTIELTYDVLEGLINLSATLATNNRLQKLIDYADNNL